MGLIILGGSIKDFRLYSLPKNVDLNNFNLTKEESFRMYVVPTANLPLNRPTGVSDGYLMLFSHYQYKVEM